jgi:hypothetical protein
MATANLKSQKKIPALKYQNSSPKELLILKKCSFASSFVYNLCRVAHRYIPGCCCSSFWADM